MKVSDGNYKFKVLQNNAATYSGEFEKATDALATVFRNIHVLLFVKCGLGLRKSNDDIKFIS